MSIDLAGAAPAHAAPIRGQGFWRMVAGRLARDPVSLTCAAILSIIALAAIFAPWVAPGDPYRTSALGRLLPVGSPGNLLGTDELGRDMLTRLIYGARLTLLMGLTPVVAATLVGGGFGILAGFLGGRVNMAIMRTVDVMFAFPSVLLAIAISGVLGAGLANSLIALSIVFVPPVARVAESVTAQVRDMTFVEAARASGAGLLPILRVHVLGNVLGPILIFASSLVSVSMILASGLSFLGLGTRPPEPEWGLMLNTLRTAIYTDPLLAALPGAAVFITSFCFNLLSDGLRSAMNATQRD